MANSGHGGTWFETTPDFWRQIPLPVIAWKVFYADGLTVDSTCSSWEEAPSEGVQVVMVYHPNGFRTVVRGRDAYTLPSASARKFGLEIPLDDYRAILARAMADPWRPE